jgi:hypothetical protein
MRAGSPTCPNTQNCKGCLGTNCKGCVGTKQHFAKGGNHNRREFKPFLKASTAQFFITFFRYARHRHSPQSLRAYLSTVHHRELRQSPEMNAIPALNFSTAL